MKSLLNKALYFNIFFLLFSVSGCDTPEIIKEDTEENIENEVIPNPDFRPPPTPGTGNYGCLGVVYPINFRFLIVDKNTGQDIFFSQGAKYNAEDLIVTEAGLTFRPKVITNSTGKYLLIDWSDTKPFKRSLSLELHNEFKVNLTVTAVQDESTRCLFFVVSEVTYNNITVNGLQDKILKIKI